MAEMLSVNTVINDILMGLMPVIEEEKRIKDAEQVLYMTLANLQIFKEETALSVDLDLTDDYLDQYLLSMRLDGCTEKSIYNYKNNLKNMLDYVNKNIKDITYMDLKRYLAYGKLVRQWKDRTYNSKLIAIRSFFGWLYEEDMLPDNPAKKLKETKVERRMGPVLNPEQREEVRCACESELELALCDLLYTSGIRISELCGLNIQDIDFTTMRAVVYGKGRKEREIYFNGQAKVHLERYLESRDDDNPALFVSSKKPHNRLTDQSIRNILKKLNRETRI